MNKDIILKDKSRLEEMLKTKVNVFDGLNIKSLINYLDKIVKIIDKYGEFELAWGTKDGLPKCFPLSLVIEKAYGIDAANYIEIDSGEHIVEIDLHNLADLIAYSFMSRDLDETHESIEELLKDCGIIGLEDSNLIINHFKENEDKPYEFSKSFKIGNTPYYSYENKEIIDYFNTKSFKTKAYKDVVEYSCKYASTIIMNNIIDKSIHHGLKLKPLIINATAVAFIINTNDEFDIKNNLIDDISIRIFGRKFKVDTLVEVL